MPTGVYPHKKGVDNKICPICKKGFHAKPSHFKWRKYCSKKCHNKSLIGSRHSREIRKKMSLAQLKRYQNPEERKKLSEIRKGENHWNWQGGFDRKKYNQEWRKKNHKRIKELNGRRRIKKLGNGGLHTFGEWENLIAQYNWTCPCCKKSEPEIKLTEDHIIPLSKGGSDNIENIQPLCRGCNSQKHTAIIKYNY